MFLLDEETMLIFSPGYQGSCSGIWSTQYSGELRRASTLWDWTFLNVYRHGRYPREQGEVHW